MSIHYIFGTAEKAEKPLLFRNIWRGVCGHYEVSDVVYESLDRSVQSCSGEHGLESSINITLSQLPASEPLFVQCHSRQSHCKVIGRNHHGAGSSVFDESRGLSDMPLDFVAVRLVVQLCFVTRAVAKYYCFERERVVHRCAEDLIFNIRILSGPVH